MELQNFYKNFDEKFDERESMLTELKNSKTYTNFNWVSDMFEKLYINQDKDIIIYYNMDNDTEKRVKYKEFYINYNKLINFLRKNRMKKGSIIYVMTPAIIEQWYIIMASLKAGFTLIPLAPNLTEYELKYRFSNVEPDAVIADENNMKKIINSLSNNPLKIAINSFKDCVDFDEIYKENSNAEPEKLNINDIFIKYFTSGTTGMPKTVNHSSVLYPLGQLSNVMLTGIRNNYIHNNLSSPGWAKFAWSSFFAPLSVGATVLTVDYSGKLNTKRYLEILEKYNVNSFCAPPTAWRQFLSLNLDGIKLNSLKETVSAGEPLNAEIINKWKNKFGTTIRDYYGQTESTGIIGNMPGSKVIPGSMGKISPLYNIVLLDDEMNEINKSYEPGLIAVKNYENNYGLFLSYSDKEKNKSVFINNYYLTGDKAFKDDNNHFFFVSRSDDVIKYSDYRIGPFEVESAIITSECVLESAVIGSPDRLKYQKVKAFIVLKPEFNKNEETAKLIFNSVKKLLPPYKLPEIIEFTNELPKTISGKIRRNELRGIERDRKENNAEGEYEYFMKKY